VLSPGMSRIKPSPNDENNSRAIREGRELEKKEKSELFKILKNEMETWWN
jgi:hypothetical protein